MKKIYTQPRTAVVTLSCGALMEEGVRIGSHTVAVSEVDAKQFRGFFDDEEEDWDDWGYSGWGEDE